MTVVWLTGPHWSRGKLQYSDLSLLFSQIHDGKWQPDRWKSWSSQNKITFVMWTWRQRVAFVKMVIKRRKAQINHGWNEPTRVCNLRGQSQEASGVVKGQTAGMRKLGLSSDIPRGFLVTFSPKDRSYRVPLLTASTNALYFLFIPDKQIVWLNVFVSENDDGRTPNVSCCTACFDWDDRFEVVT
jgi:hypothetical protein